MIAVILVLCFSSFAQEKYWVDINSDLDSACNKIKQLGLKIENKSEWLNAVSIYLEPSDINVLSNQDFVSKVEKVRTFELASRPSYIQTDTYWDYLQEMKPEILDSLKLDAEGVIVGVIDAGFTNADSSAWFEHIFGENRILGFKDFINDNHPDFFEAKTSGDVHGHNVLGYTAGYDPEKDEKIGLATGAMFYLARTENGDKEHLVEEDDWVEAIEWMHEKGVQIVNTSLGYSEFDDAEENHELSDMNGRTTKISRAAQIATEEKGMFLVISAGNMGHKKWKYITAPADARGVLTVGATNQQHKTRIFYSSVGVEFVNYIKPNVASYSDKGTSYSAPSVTGFVACLMQYAPGLNVSELKEVVEKSSHLYPYGNNYVGYGVPQADRAIGLINKDYDPETNTWMELPAGSKVKIELNDVETDKYVVIFNKKDAFKVIDQDAIRVRNGKGKGGKLKIKVKNGDAVIQLKRKNEDVTFTTVQYGQYVVEVEW